MAKQEELTRFYMSNTELKDSTGNVDKSAIKDWSAQVRQMTSALESATNGLVKVIKTIDENGNALATFDVKRSQTGNAQPVFNRVLGNIETRYGYQAGSLAKDPYSAGLNQAEDFRRIAFYKSFHGADAKRAAKEAMEAVGGIAVSDPSRKLRDRMRLEFSVSEAEWVQALQNAGGDATKATSSLSSSFVRNNLKEADSYSRDVTTNKREREKAKEEAEAEKAQKAQLKAIEKDKKEKDAASLKNARLIQKMESDAAKEEARQKAKKEKEEAKQKVKEEREAKANRRKMLHWLTIAVSFLAGIADITRRILTASLARASEIKRDSLNAKSLGITYSDMREYRAQETAMGLEKGIITAGMSELQAGIGDITNLDQNMLSELAKVLKSDVVEGINLGLGQTDLDNVYKEILNTYFARGQAGVNSAGMQVGKYQAERELATALEKAGLGKIAEVLRNMFYTQDTGIYRGRLSTQDAFSDYMGLTTAYTMGFSTVDNRHFAELGQVVDNVKAKFVSLKENLEKLVLVSLEGLINKIDNWDIGKSSEEKANENATNLRLNQQARSKMTALAQASSNRANALFAEVGIDFSSFGEGATAETVITELNKSGWNIGALSEDKKAAYNAMLQFARTDKGRQAIYSLITANQASKKAQQADEAITKGRKKGNINYNKTAYTDAAIQSEVQDIIESFYTDEERKKTSNANLNYNTLDLGIYDIPVLGLLNKATDSGYSYSSSALYTQLSNEYYGGKRITYDEALASGSSFALTQALYDMLPDSMKGKAGRTGKVSEKKQREAVKRALDSGALTQEDVYNLMSTHVAEGWGFSSAQIYGAKKLFNATDALSANEQAGVNNILSSVLALQQAQNYLSKHNAESVVATIGGYDEKRGTVQVVLSIKGGDEKSPKEVLSFSTDSVLGKNKYYEADLDTVFNSSQNKEATR